MAFIEKVTEEKIVDFYTKNFTKETTTKTKTVSIDAELISTGWFVKESFTANHKLNAHAFIFCDHKVLYLPGSDERFVTDDTRKKLSEKYFSFLKQEFGKEYVDSRLQFQIEQKQKEQQEIEQTIKHMHELQISDKNQSQITNEKTINM